MSTRANDASRSSDDVQELLNGLSAKEARRKYACAKALRDLAEKQPETLFPHFSFFAALLSQENKILQWEAIRVLSHLAKVDSEHRFDDIFDVFFATIPGPVMITAANTIAAAARIALARPDLADRIAAEVLKVRRACYQTAECRNVAIGHAIVAFDQFVHLLTDSKSVHRFVRVQLRNRRAGTRAKAERFLRHRAAG